MKQFLLPLTALLAITATASAETFKDGPFTFTTLEGNNVEVTKADSKDGSGTAYTTYSIPATVSYNSVDYTVTTIGREAFRWSSAIKIDLPNTLVDIGYGAFNGASNLTSITIPTGVKKIGDYAMSSTGITSIDIPASVEEIGYSTFFTCKSLTSITMHEGLKKIGGSAFYKVPITAITLPESLEELGAKAFLYCEKLKTVKLPSKLTVLGDATFMNCSSLASIEMPQGLTEIGVECFLQTALTEATIPATVKTIGTSAFARTATTRINLAAGNESFVLIDGNLYDAARRLLYAVPMKGVSKVDVASTCVGINGGAFWGSGVSKVTLPEGLLAIDDYAFCQSSLAEINFPSTLTYIGEQGFAATQLTDVTLPANMPYVLDGAFAGCEKMTKLTIPSGVKLIYNHAFHNNKNLTSVTCQSSVAPELDDVYETYDSPFYGVPETTPLYIPKGSTASYKEAGWNEYFKLVEGENATLAYTAITPADGSVIERNAAMRVDIEFASDITIVNSNPEVFLRKGSELSGAIVEPDDCWKATKGDNGKSVRVWASDYDGYTQYFTPAEDTEYYLVIPAGIVKNAEGDLNERIVVKWVGPSAPKALEVVSITPADGSILPSGYFNMSFIITFADDITIIDYGPDATLRESDPATGKTIDPDDCWKATKEDAKSIKVWASDYDGFLQSFKVNDALTYYMTIPANIVKNEAGDKNEEIVIELKGASAGIDNVDADNNVYEAEHYDIAGRRISATAKGMHIVRMSDGTVRKTMVK